MSYVINITEEMKVLSLEFAKEIIVTDNQYDRLSPTQLTNTEIKKRIRIERTYAGKLAECAVLQLLQDKGIDYEPGEMFTIHEGQQNVDDHDFITKDGRKVDVKAAYRDNHMNLVVNKEQFEKEKDVDFYIGVKLNASASTLVDNNGRILSKNLINEDSITEAIIYGYAERNFLNGLEYKNLGESDCKCYSLNSLLDIDRLLILF